MKTGLWVLALLVAGAGIGAASDENPNPRDMPRLPGTRLLVGDPPWLFALTTGNETLILEPQIGLADVAGFYPGLTRDGNTVAAARWKDYDRDIVIIGTYSVADKKWTDYTEGQYPGSVAISPDGSTLAFAAEFERIGEDGFHRVRIVNLRTGEWSLGPAIHNMPVTVSHMSASYNVVLSWSPDAQRLVYSNGTTVEVWDLQTKKTWPVADGQMPAWAPGGEWIAYLVTPKNSAGFGSLECAIVRPDGTGNKTLVKLPRGRVFLEPPVWSPDSKTLLLNEMADGEKWTMNIDLLDLSTLKLKKELTNKMPVFAWAEAK